MDPATHQSPISRFFRKLTNGVKLCFRPSPSSITEPMPAAFSMLGPKKPIHKGKKCLVLDLDETLVHSTLKPVGTPDFVVPISVNGEIHKFYVRKRPGVDEFLEYVGSRYEVVIFTASMATYASPVIDMLDLTKTISARLYRDACALIGGDYVKDLSVLGRPLEECIIVDNSPLSFKKNNESAIGIVTWIDSENDEELQSVMRVLDDVEHVPDVRPVLMDLRAWEMGADQPLPNPFLGRDLE